MCILGRIDSLIVGELSSRLCDKQKNQMIN